MSLPSGSSRMCLREKKCEVQQKSQPFGQPSPAKILPVDETFHPNILRPAHQQRLLVRHRQLRFAQQAAKEPHPFLAAEVIAVGLERLVLEHRPVAAQDDLAVGRVLADQRDGLLHLVHDRQQEGDAHVIVALLEFADQLAPSRDTATPPSGRRGSPRCTRGNNGC